MPDTEIAQLVKEKAYALCQALNIAGKAGLQINIAFNSTNRDDGDNGDVRIYGWYSAIKLHRILKG